MVVISATSFLGNVNRRILVQASLFGKITKADSTRYVAQVVECLLSKCKGPSTNPSNHQEKKGISFFNDFNTYYKYLRSIILVYVSTNIYVRAGSTLSLMVLKYIYIFNFPK
jgi:hypothetical protein